MSKKHILPLVSRSFKFALYRTAARAHLVVAAGFRPAVEDSVSPPGELGNDSRLFQFSHSSHRVRCPSLRQAGGPSLQDEYMALETKPRCLVSYLQLTWRNQPKPANGC